MAYGHNPKLRLGLSLHAATRPAFSPSLSHAPPLPAVNYALVGKAAPVIPATPGGTLPRASAVVITWAEAEWAALQQVFCGGTAAMPYADRSKSTWPGWQIYSADLPSGAASGWSFWGQYRLVELGGTPVLLFKSNTHLDFPGPSFLETMIDRLIAAVQPAVILSVGTAGGANPQDHIGTVRAVSAGTLYSASQPASDWPVYSNAWTAPGTTLANPDFARLLFPVPTTAQALQTLEAQFNSHSRSGYTLAQLDPNGLNMGDSTPRIVDQTGGAVSLLTTSTFVVGTTAGDYAGYSSIEMDDAVIGEACAAKGVAFGFVRNISDPVQNAVLPASVQGGWGSAVYDAYGLYTSYNGALAAWAMLA